MKFPIHINFHWPSERQGFTTGLWLLTLLLLFMARENPELWNVKLFEVIIQAVVLTGLLNTVGAFLFSSNEEFKNDR